MPTDPRSSANFKRNVTKATERHVIIKLLKTGDINRKESYKQKEKREMKSERKNEEFRPFDPHLKALSSAPHCARSWGRWCEMEGDEEEGAVRDTGHDSQLASWGPRKESGVAWPEVMGEQRIQERKERTGTETKKKSEENKVWKRRRKKSFKEEG